MRWRTRAVVCAVAAVVVTGSPASAPAEPIAAPPAAPSVASPAAPEPAPAAAGQARTVTLVTGDQVTVSDVADGQQLVTVAPGAGRERIGFARRSGPDGVRVVPVDAQPLLAAGRLDSRLFDVSALIRAGYHDAAGTDLPLTVDKAPHRVAPEDRGRFWAQARDGGARIRLDGGSTKAVADEPEFFDVTINLVDRDGKPASDDLPQFVDILPLTYPRDSWPPEAIPENGTVTVQLEKGRYAFVGDIFTGPDADSASITRATAPPVDVDRDLTLTFDARAGKRVSAIVDARDSVRTYAELDTQFIAHGSDGSSSPIFNAIGAGPDNALYAVPLRLDPAEFTFGYTSILTSPKGAARPYTYYLAFPVPGAVPADPTFRARNRDLGATYSRTRSMGVDEALASRADAPIYLPDQAFFNGYLHTIALPERRLEFHSTAGHWKGLLVQRTIDQPNPTRPEGAVYDDETAYTAGTVDFQEWNTAVPGPDLSTHDFGNGVVRFGDNLQVVIPMFAPAEAGHTGVAGYDFSYVTGRTVLSKDGHLVGYSDLPGQGFFQLVPGPARYALVVDARRDVGWSALATRVQTAWTFTTQHPDEFDVVPLPTVRIATPTLDDHNRASRSGLTPLDLSVHLQADSTPNGIASLTLEYSGDDGATWAPVRVVRGDGDTWRAAVRNPDTDHVSLRVKATTTRGDTVDQTVIRAYALTNRKGTTR